MTTTISSTQRSAFYQAALIGLHALEAAERKPRRFGVDADARWSSFAGHLGLAQRLDLLIRDAAVTWGLAFSPAQIFRLPGLAEDEPFGPDWSSLPGTEVKRLWSAPHDHPSLSAAAEVLQVPSGSVTLPTISSTTRLFVAGGSALRATAEHFAAHPDLSWNDQVAVVAEEPHLLQFAGLVAPLTGARGPTRAICPTDEVTKALSAGGIKPGGVAVVSDDAAAAEAAFARNAAGA